MSGAVGHKRVPKEFIEEYSVPLPPLAEQERIVAKLDAAFAAIDQGIALAEKKEAEVEHLKAALLSASLSGDDWKTVKLGEVSEYVRGPFGGSLKKNIFVDKGYAVYEQMHPINNQCESFRYFITEDKFEEMSRFKVVEGDILMSCSGTIGKTTIVPPDAPKGIINQALLKISPSSKLNVKFLRLFMSSRLFNEQLMDTVDGAAIKNVASVKVLKQLLIQLPPLAEQERIVAKLDAAFAELETACIAIAETKANYQALKAAILAQELKPKESAAA